MQILDRIRERVALAERLGPDRSLHPDAQERALACLERFGQRLRHLTPERVRAVGTNTLRNARNSRAFLRRARSALGHEIEVIEGREEARMIYNGVIHSRSTVAARTLVVDIGGGSTECILGEGNETRMTDSLQMGCLVYSERFFTKGQISKERMRKAHLAAGLELEPIALSYKNHGWDACLGSSGTIRAISEILAANGLGGDGIEPKGLRKLRKLLVSAKHVDRLDLAGLAADRAPVLPGGVAILSAVFKDFDIQRMHSSEGALREGLLIDLLGRIRHEDVRDATVESFMTRYNVDRAQAGRVEAIASKLLGAAGKLWKLDDKEASALMGWAARLHEIGLSVNYSGYHKHGAYLVSNAYMPGFSPRRPERPGVLDPGPPPQAEPRCLRAPALQARLQGARPGRAAAAGRAPQPQSQPGRVARLRSRTQRPLHRPDLPGRLLGPAPAHTSRPGRGGSGLARAGARAELGLRSCSTGRTSTGCGG